jgi:hypothetical protein
MRQPRGLLYTIALFLVCSAPWRSNFADTIAKLRLNSKVATLPFCGLVDLELFV